MREMTLEDLRRIMHEAAGESDADIGAGNSCEAFDALGYDSLALLETLSRVEREYGVSLPDDLASTAGSPSAFVASVNDSLKADR